MIAIKQAAEKAINLGKQLQAIIDVGKVLDQIGDLENAKVEAERDTKSAILTKEKFLKELSNVEQKLVVAKTDFKNVQEKTKKYSEESIVRHNSLIAEGRKERDKLITVATQGANELIAKANQTVKSLQEKRDRLLKEITDAQVAVTNLENQMRALKDRLGV